MKFKDKLDNIKRFTSFQEKEALLESSGSKNIIKISNILGLSPDNELEAEAMLLKAREISVSEVIEVTSDCPVCKKINLYNIDISTMFFNKNLNPLLPEGLFEDLSQLPEKYSGALEDLDLDEYNKLEEQLLENNKAIFNPIVDVSCMFCGEKYKISIDAISSISKFNLTNIYEQYSDITYFSNMTKKDVDDMYPFEREIFMGLIQKKEDEE